MGANASPTDLVYADDLSAAECESLLADLVAPRPIAWISTRSAEGRRNLAPFSSFTAVCACPPLISVSIGPRDGRPKDTLENLRATGVFCVNRVTEPLLEAMRRTAADFAPHRDEFDVACVSAAQGALVDAPYVLESPAVLECRLFRELTLPAGFALVIGQVVAFRLGPTNQAHRADGAVGHFGADGYVTVRGS